MALSLLGPLQVDGDGRLSPRDRVVLSALAVHSGDVLSAERLADALWGEAPPASWAKVVQGSIVRLRRSLGHDAVETTSGGYRLAVGDDEIDIRLFERLVGRGRALATAGEHQRAGAVFSQALDLWRGAALVDVEHWPDGRAEAIRLEELRQTTEEALLDARLASGVDIVADASASVRAGPLREHRWWVLAVALYRSGRQSEALGAIRQARRTLQEDLGLDLSRELVELEQAILQQAPALDVLPAESAADSGLCPWKGLLVYDRADSDWFFGRDDEVTVCLRALRDSPLLLVAGPSGSGKSSLVRAGVIPALVRAGDSVALLTPGTDPAGALVAGLSSSPRADQVVVVDQLEELFTAGHPAAVVGAFLDRLVELATGGVRVIAVVRADQVGGLSASPAMARLVDRGMHLVTPMTEVDLREAVEGPAAQAGLRLEPGLVELLVREIQDEPGALPLLSHALAETWVRREAGVLTVEGYRATGGIRGAVAQSAEQMWESLAPDQRASVRALWLRLVTPSPGGEPAAVRLPLSVAAPDPERARVVDLLVRCRLVTTDERSVTVAHEAVIRAWPRLRSWLDDDAAGHLTLRHLSVAAEDWDGRGRPDSELYRGSRLEAALTWRQVSTPDLTAVEHAFLDAGEARARAEREAAESVARHQMRQNRRLRVTLAATALGMVLALIAGSVAVQRSRDASRTARDALVDRLAAQSVALRSTQRDLAALLAVEAHRLRPDARTRGALLGVFTAAPGLLGYLPTGGAGEPGVPLSSGRMLADGRTMLAVGVDGVIRVVDIDGRWTGKSFPGPDIVPSRALIDVSRDETTVAEVSWEGSEDGGGRATLGVYDVRSRTRRVPDVRLPMDVGAVAVSPTGRYVAVSGYDDGRVFVFDTEGETRLPELASVDENAPRVVALPPVGPAAHTDALQDYVEGRVPRPVWLGDPRLDDPRLDPSGEVNTDGVRYTAALAFRPDGLLVVGSEVGTVRVVDPRSGREEDRLTGAPWLTSNRTATLSADGAVLVTTGTRGAVGWDLERHRPRWVADIDGDNCSAVVIEPRSQSVLCGGRFSRVVSLDLETGRETPDTYAMQRGEISALLLTPDGNTLVQLSETQGVIATWRLDGIGPITRELPGAGTPTQYNADGSLLHTTGPRVVAVDDRRWLESTVVSAESGEVVWRSDEFVDMTWTSHPHQIVGWTPRGIGIVLDVRAGRRVSRLQNVLGDFPNGVSLAAGGRHLLGWVLGGFGGAVVAVWDLSTGKAVAARQVPDGTHGSLTEDGRLVVWVHDGGASTYDMSLEDGDEDADGQTLATRRGLVTAAVSSSGLVAASRTDGRLGFYDARTLKPSGPPLAGTPGQVEQLSFSRDGHLLAVRGATGALRLIDTRARIQLGEPIELGLDRTRRVALRADGHELTVATDDGIRMWDLRPKRWTREACELVGRDLTREEWATYLAPVGAYRSTCR